MEMEEITIKVDAQAARAYKSASTEEQRKMELLFNAWFREAAKNKLSLREIMDMASDQAQANGLTPEILEELLHE